MKSTPLEALWDAHVHLPAYADPARVAAEAKRRGIRLVSVTISPKEVPLCLALGKENPSTVMSFIGVHPSEAVSTPKALADLLPFWEAAEGVGEVGLDPKYSDVSTGSAQLSLFEGQVEVAERLSKPLQVHSRGAEAACLDVLEGRSLRSVLMHWFESEELLGRALSLPRTYVSFGPALLYSKKLQRCAKICSPEAVLVESDGPVPFAALGGPDGPGLLPSVVFKLAELWGRGFEEAVSQLEVNSRAYLG